MPRRGGLTITRSGAVARRAANAVASPAANRTPARPASARAQLALATASTLVSMPTTSRPRRGHVQREPADAAVQVPHATSGASSSTQVARLPVQRGGDLGVRLEEALRAQVQVDPVDAHPQRLAASVSRISRSPSSTALWSGSRFTDATRSVRQRVEQPRQVLADPGDRLLRAQHEPHHELAVRRLGDQQVLQLAACGAGTSYGVSARARDERREHREAPPASAPGYSAAVPQVDARARRRRGCRASARSTVPPTTIFALLR